MQAVRKAVWFIESHFAEPIRLDDIAAVTGLSRFHLARTFGQSTGLSIGTYLRGRRIAHAARTLAEGAPDIFSVALSVGYGSHEAFTRAFRDTLGVTPEQVRAMGRTDALPLLEPPVMTAGPLPVLSAPAVVDGGPLLLAGVRAHRSFTERAGIPSQWQALAPYLADFPGRVGGDTFGACLAPAQGEDGFDYLCAVAVLSLAGAPEGLSGLHLEPRRYAVFRHNGHVSTIGDTCAAIFETWAPDSGEALDDGPLFLLERYGAAFDPAAGTGDIALWIPLRQAVRER